MEILFVSDYVCPYCLVTKEALKQALEELKLKAKITWHPFELTQEPTERVDTFHDETRRGKYQVLVDPCEKLGLAMKLPPNVIPRPYTRLAFEGWHYACEQGKGEEYNDLMYRAYFIDEKDIGELSVLTELAVQVGLDAEEFTDVLKRGIYTEKQAAAVELARKEWEIKHVPTIYINGEEMSPVFTKEEMMAVLSREYLKTADEELACGIDGCG